MMIASFFIMVAGAVSAQNQILKAGGVDDAGVANAYYETIDPDNERTTQSDWEEVNGFNDPLNTVVTAAGYFNQGDLGFFRSIQMVRDQRPDYEGNIAFTTANYLTETDALAGTNKVSIVNMEYSQGPEEDLITKFYVYAADGSRQISTTFSIGGEELFLPAACFSCHGGDDDAESPMPSEGYNGGSGETNGSFLVFDVNTMAFSNNVLLANLEAAFKEFNKAILQTDPTKATKKLIKGLYGGSALPNATQDTSYIPASWAGDPKNAELYKEVIVPSCLNCHTTSDTKLLSLSWWKDNPDKVRESVFHEMTMPNSIPGYNRFVNSTAPNQQQILLDSLDRFENN